MDKAVTDTSSQEGDSGSSFPSALPLKFLITDKTNPLGLYVASRPHEQAISVTGTRKKDWVGRGEGRERDKGERKSRKKWGERGSHKGTRKRAENRERINEPTGRQRGT